MIANNPFIILVNASVICVNFFCPSSVLLNDSFNAKKAPTIKPTTPNAAVNPLPNLFTDSLKP